MIGFECLILDQQDPTGAEAWKRETQTRSSVGEGSVGCRRRILYLSILPERDGVARAIYC